MEIVADFGGERLVVKHSVSAPASSGARPASATRMSLLLDVDLFDLCSFIRTPLVVPT